jgi:hypothetical protein
MMQKLDLSEQEIFDSGLILLQELWDDARGNRRKTTGQFLDNFAIRCMDFKIEAFEETVDAKYEAFDWLNAKSFDEVEDLVLDERKVQMQLSRQMRLIRQPKMEPLDDIGHHMTLKEFISCVKSVGLLTMMVMASMLI